MYKENNSGLLLSPKAIFSQSRVIAFFNENIINANNWLIINFCLHFRQGLLFNFIGKRIHLRSTIWLVYKGGVGGCGRIRILSGPVFREIVLEIHPLHPGHWFKGIISRHLFVIIAKLKSIWFPLITRHLVNSFFSVANIPIVFFYLFSFYFLGKYLFLTFKHSEGRKQGQVVLKHEKVTS